MSRLSRPLRSAWTVRLLSLLLVGLLVGVVFPGTAHAQITITESDIRTYVGEEVAIQEFHAVNPSNLQSLFDQSGADQTFDLAPYEFEAELSGTVSQWEMSNAPSEAPCRERFESRDANLVTEYRFEGRASASDTTFWAYERLTSSSREFSGVCSTYDEDVDGDGENPDTLGIEWEPALLQGEIPLNYEDSWSQNAELLFIPSNPSEHRSSREWNVDAYGSLVTPAGSAPALRIRSDIQDTTSAGGFVVGTTRSTELSFVTRDRRLNATIQRDDDTGEITEALFQVRADEGASFEVAQGATSSLDGPGANVTFTQAPTSAGTLNVSRFDAAPLNTSFSDESAESDDGTSVTPNRLWEGRYFAIQNRGLEGFTADVCVDISSVPGVSDSGKLVLLTRETANNDWSPLSSSLDGSQLCATVSSFSQFAVGSDSEYNALPVELTDLRAHTDGTDRAVLTWQTTSETNNAGFDVQHQASGSSDWNTLSFVESSATSGTAAEPQSYRYRTEALGPGTHRFRLRQVDLDGSTSLSDPIQVELQMDEPLRLSAPAPNPASEQSHVSFALNTPTKARLALYNVLGQHVATLYEGTPQAGEQQTVELNAETLSSGAYLLRLEADGQTRTQRLTIVK